MVKQIARFRGVWMLAALHCFFGSAGCSSEATEVRIGVLLPLTGSSGAAGTEMKAAGELARDIANDEITDILMTMAKNKGISSMDNANIVLFFEDHAGDPAKGKAAAEKLIAEKQVHMIVGAYNSAVTKEIAEVCKQKQILMVNDASTSPALTQSGNPWFFRTTPHDGYFIQDLYKFLAGMASGQVQGVASLDKTEISTLAAACESSSWGSDTCSLIESLATTNSFELKQKVSYDSKAANLADEVQTKVKPMLSSNANVFLFASYSTDAIEIIKMLKQEKAAPKVVWGNDAGFETSDFVQEVGDDIVGVLTRTVFLSEVTEKKKVAEQINQRFKEKTNLDLNGNSARAFTALQTAVQIFEKAGSTDPAELQNAANTLNIQANELVVPWSGIKFSSSAEEQGQNIMGSGIIAQYQKDSSGKVVKHILYPFDLATADMIYPFPGY